MHPCEKIKRALDGYSDLTHGIKQYSRSLQHSEDRMGVSSKRNTEKIEQFRREIDDHGKSADGIVFSFNRLFSFTFYFGLS